MRFLFLDDELERFLTLQRNHPNIEIIWVQTVDAAKQCIRSLRFTHIFLDHDLGIRPDIDNEFPDWLTSRPFVEWLVEKHTDNPDVIAAKFIVHSSNPIGADWLNWKLNSTNVFKSIQVGGAWQKVWN